MTLQQLMYFVATLEHGSFSGAADALRMAQPSLSEQVRRLEDELGVSLFERVGRGVVATEAGRTLRPHAERVIADVEDARASVVEVREMRGGTVSLGMFGNAPYYLLTDLIGDFRARHPDVRVRIVGQNSSEVADALRAGEVEAAVIALPVDDSGLELRPLISDEILYVSPDENRVREPMTIERLAQAPLILYDARYGWEDPTRRQLADRAQRAGVTIEPAIEVEYPDAAVQLAARGLGDTVIPRAITAGPRFPRRLATVSFAEPLYDTFAVATRRGARPSPASRELVGIAERRLALLGRRLEGAR